MFRNIGTSEESLFAGGIEGTETHEARSTGHIDYCFSPPDMDKVEQFIVGWLQLFLPPAFITSSGFVPTGALKTPLHCRFHQTGVLAGLRSDFPAQLCIAWTIARFGRAVLDCGSIRVLFSPLRIASFFDLDSILPQPNFATAVYSKMANRKAGFWEIRPNALFIFLAVLLSLIGVFKDT
jgi:hypothetical protein